MKSKMKKEFLNYEGGLFSEVEKADVGDSYTKMAENGVALMGWADPFMPDFSIPEPIMEKTIEAIHSPVSSHYTAPTGNMELREIICKRAKEKYGVELKPDRNIIITPGSDSGLFFSMFPFLQRDDEVIIPCPSYPNNLQNIKMMQATPMILELKDENNYQIDLDILEALITDKTKMIVLTHPNNPTTTIYNRESLEAVRTVVLKYNLVLVCDQAFEDFTFKNEFIAPMSLPDMFEHTITVCSISKGMGLSGYRVGYIIASGIVSLILFTEVFPKWIKLLIGAVQVVTTSYAIAILIKKIGEWTSIWSGDYKYINSNFLWILPIVAVITILIAYICNRKAKKSKKK